ncbi:MAG: tRNA pseudouridine(55) synthase TruB [Bacteroidales bacterium]
MLKKFIHETRFEFPDLPLNLEGDVILIDKPYRCTSFDIVGKVKHFIRKKYNTKIKVGHAGTLDPLATGMLIVCIGRFTKKIDHYQAQEKEYTGTFHLGASTPSYDLEKPVDQTYPFEHITEEMVQKTTLAFLGEIEQIPPQFSAVKIEGRRAYEFAREGEDIEIKAKTITISEFEITRFALPEIDFRIVCSKGTYIRSIARDFGIALQSGAYLTVLRRTRIGNFKVEEGVKMLIEEDENITTKP